MPATHRKLIERATAPAKSSVELASAGKLPTEVLKRYIKTGIDQSDVLSRVTVDPMKSHTKDLDRVSVGTRIMRLATEGEAATEKQVPTHAKRTLVVKKVRIDHDHTTEYIEDNLEEDAQFLMDEFAIQFFNDGADLAVNGDEDQVGDDFLKINDGWLDLIKTDAIAVGGSQRVSNAGGSDYAATIFPAMFNLVASKYLARLKQLGFELWVDTATDSAYKRQLAARQTAMADRYLTEGGNAKFEGIEVVPQGYFPSNTQLLVPPKNLVMGYYKNEWKVNIFYDGDKDQYEVHQFGRLDFEFKVPDLNIISYNY